MGISILFPFRCPKHVRLRFFTLPNFTAVNRQILCSCGLISKSLSAFEVSFSDLRNVILFCGQNLNRGFTTLHWKSYDLPRHSFQGRFLASFTFNSLRSKKRFLCFNVQSFIKCPWPLKSLQVNRKLRFILDQFLWIRNNHIWTFIIYFLIHRQSRFMISFADITLMVTQSQTSIQFHLLIAFFVFIPIVLRKAANIWEYFSLYLQRPELYFTSLNWRSYRCPEEWTGLIPWSESSSSSAASFSHSFFVHSQNSWIEEQSEQAKSTTTDNDVFWEISLWITMDAFDFQKTVKAIIKAATILGN